MSSRPLKFYLTTIIFLVFSASCADRSSPSLPPLNEPSAVPPASTFSSEPEKDQPLKSRPAPLDLSTTSTFNVILGRPTTDAITASLLSSTPQEVTLVYGTESGNYTYQSNPVSLEANAPQNIELSQLQPDTAYFYTIQGVSSFGEHTFHTQRAPGSTFTFTIDADPHNRDPRFNGDLYATTLSNALNDHPDFHINLGDTFMTEKVKPQSYAEAESTFTDMRPYFGILNADAPRFLVNGNHEGELGWLLNGKDSDMPIWSAELRQLYYPNPSPNRFYTGGSTTDTYLNGVRDCYYAWTWGDALFIVLDPFWYTTDKPKPDDLNNNWGWTLGKEQYDWLKTTLETSSSNFKFVFTHHLVGGGENARGGIEVVPYFEWGGNNADGSYGFDEQRPGWGMPIHSVLVENGVNAVFHGHDHVFVKQDLDGIVYQELPQPSNANPDNANLATEYGYINGDVVAGSGRLRVTVTPEAVTVEYVRSYLAKDEKDGQRNGQADYSYIINH